MCWVNPKVYSRKDPKDTMHCNAASVDMKTTKIIRAGKRHHLSDQKWWGVGLSGQQQKNVKVTEIENTQRWDLSTGKPLRLPATSSLLRRAMIWNNNAMFVWSREGESERNLKYRSVESVKTKTTEITLLELYQPAETRHDLADADALGRRLMWVIRVMVRVWSAPSHSAYVDYNTNTEQPQHKYKYKHNTNTIEIKKYTQKIQILMWVDPSVMVAI